MKNRVTIANTMASRLVAGIDQTAYRQPLFQSPLQSALQSACEHRGVRALIMLTLLHRVHELPGEGILAEPVHGDAGVMDATNCTRQNDVLTGGFVCGGFERNISQSQDAV